MDLIALCSPFTCRAILVLCYTVPVLMKCESSLVSLRATEDENKRLMDNGFSIIYGILSMYQNPPFCLHSITILKCVCVCMSVTFVYTFYYLYFS